MMQNRGLTVKYYAAINIPENFSECIASAQNTDKQIAEIKFSSNEKRNYLATQILGKAVDQMELKIRGKVNTEIVSELCEKLNSTPEKLTTLATGLNELSDGTASLEDGTDTLQGGTSQLKSGTQTLEGKLSEFSDGAKSADGGSTQLAAGIADLQNGIDALAKGGNDLSQATENIDELRTQSKALADGAAAFNEGLTRYTDGVGTLIATVENTGAF
ncbi:MAG: hypothetical protein QM793_08735 [Muricomes sp.]